MTGWRGPSAHDLNQMFWHAAAGGRGDTSDSEEVSREMYGRDAGQSKNVTEVLVEPEAGNHLTGFGGEQWIILGCALKCPEM